MSLLLLQIRTFINAFDFRTQMDPNAFSALCSVYCQEKGTRHRRNDHDGVIDLGLSLSTLQPQVAYHHHHPSPSHHSLMSLGGSYGDQHHRHNDIALNWTGQQQHQQMPEVVYLKNLTAMEYYNYQSKPPVINTKQDYEEETDEFGGGVESKQQCGYVKVNMDGVIVGRKVCVLDHATYSTLASQLEDIFGGQSVSGLRLFQTESEFSLMYKDRDDNWRFAGDMPWNVFVECVKRLRIARKNEAVAP